MISWHVKCSFINYCVSKPISWSTLIIIAHPIGCKEGGDNVVCCWMGIYDSAFLLWSIPAHAPWPDQWSYLQKIQPNPRVIHLASFDQKLQAMIENSWIFSILRRHLVSDWCMLEGLTLVRLKMGILQYPKCRGYFLRRMARIGYFHKNKNFEQQQDSDQISWLPLIANSF